jgi:hypothetical protein
MARILPGDSDLCNHFVIVSTHIPGLELGSEAADHTVWE